MLTLKNSFVVLTVGIGLGAVAIGSQGCSLGSDTIVNVSEAPVTDDGGASSVKPASSGTGGTTCDGKFAKPDLAKLKACKEHGHCYDKTKLPSELSTQLIPCDDPGQVCVPDEVISAGGNKLKSCTMPDALKSVTGEAGGCITMALIPEMQKQGGSFLKQQECDAGQVCVPCKNPQANGADTPFCLPIGVSENACTGGGGGGADGGAPAGGAQKECCTTNGKSNGVCMGGLKGDQADFLPEDVCNEGDRCVPAPMAQGKGVSCKAGVILGAGVCLDKCFNTMMSIAGFLGVLSSDGCGSTEVCVPCNIIKSQAGGFTVPGCE